MWSSMAQPTTFLLKRSMTAAREAQPESIRSSVLCSAAMIPGSVGCHNVGRAQPPPRPQRPR